LIADATIDSDSDSASSTRGAALNHVSNSFVASSSNVFPAQFRAPLPQPAIQDVVPPVQPIAQDTQKVPTFQGHKISLDEWVLFSGALMTSSRSVEAFWKEISMVLVRK